VIGAAFALTGTVGADKPPATDPSALDEALRERGERAASRGFARATQAPASTGTQARAAAPATSPAPEEPAEPGAGLPPTPEDCEEYSGNRQIGCTLLGEFGFGIDQMPALDSLWSHESGWNHEAYNASSGAYGIPQALPGDKMASVADDWETNPATQIRWGLGYIRDRYGSPDAAWAFFQSNGWY
jgi:hypothetical protein